nr:uncharacterized protein BN887_03580 [Melanopsichium pennsylvanicum 4]
MRPPQQQTQTSQAQPFPIRPGAGGSNGAQHRPPPVPTNTGAKQGTPQQQNARPPNNTATVNNGANVSPSMPATIQALQQQLAISLATSNLSAEQINGLAIQLYKQAQAQQVQAQAQVQQQQPGGISATGVRPQQANVVATAAAGGNTGNARPPQQILNQAIQALALQNAKNQQSQQQQQQ